MSRASRNPSAMSSSTLFLVAVIRPRLHGYGHTDRARPVRIVHHDLFEDRLPVGAVVLAHDLVVDGEGDGQAVVLALEHGGDEQIAGEGLAHVLGEEPAERLDRLALALLLGLVGPALADVILVPWH